MALAARMSRVVTLGSPLLAAFPVENGGVHVQGKAARRLSQEPQKPDPEQTPARFDARLGELVEKSPDRVFARKACDSQHLVQSPIVPKQS